MQGYPGGRDDTAAFIIRTTYLDPHILDVPQQSLERPHESFRSL